MYEDGTQNYDAEVHEEYLIDDTASTATSFYNHVQTIAYLQTHNYRRLKGDNCI